MDKITGYLFLLIALLWLLPLVGVDALAGTVSDWLSTVALAVIGIKGVTGK